MSNEKQINNISWKAGLDELAVLPAEPPFNTDTSWQKLELRMNRKSSSKKMFFYWMAAASVLTCIILFGITLNSKQDIAVPAPIVQNNIPAIKKESVQTFPVKEKKDIVLKNQNKKIKTINDPYVNHIKKPEITVTKADAIIEFPITKVDSITINPVAVQNIQSKPVVFPSFRKKIPVVHINELEKPVNPGEEVAGNSVRPTLRSRLFNRQPIQDSDAEPNQGGTILRIKLSPQN